MRVSGLDENGDWRFGKSKAQYLTNGDCVRQNVITRIKSFVNDWFADISHGVDWFNLLGKRKNETKILRAIEKIVLETPGVSTIDLLRLQSLSKDRVASIELQFTTIYGKAFAESFGVDL